MRSYRCWLLSALAAVSLWSGIAQAQTFSHSAYLDLDSNPATGCAVTTAAGAVSGIETRLTASVTGQPPMVAAVTREACVGAGFGAPQAQAAGYPVGLNIGVGGADVVEFATSLTGLGNGGPARIVFVSSSASGADQVTVNGVILQGTTATGFSTPAIIPATGLLTLLALVGLVLWLVRKHPGFGSSMALLLLLGVGVVWAANFVTDGQVGDWVGEPQRASDASNDSTSGESQIDLVAAFAATEAGQLFLRVDVREAQSNAPVFASAAATTFTVGTPGTFTVTATGTPTPTLSQSGGTLPNGVTFNPATGVLSGTPAAGTGGTYALQFSATNAQGTTTQSFTLTVNQAPAITSSNATTFTLGSAGSFTVTASGFPAPTFALTGTLPSGVTFNSATGLLSGTAGAGTGGSYPLSITATNVAGTSPTQSFTLTVNSGPVFTSANATTFTVGTAGTFTVTATGTPAPTLSLTSGVLPTGVTFNPATGVLAGTPAAGTGGSYALQFTATNAQGSTTQAFTLTVNQAPTITSANATAFTTGSAGTFTVTASGFPAPTFALTGALPSGVTFSAATGVLSGTPGAGTGGSYPLSITATNAVGTSPAQSFTLTVNDGPIFTSANTTTFAVGVAGSFTVTATGTPAPTLSQTSGILPTGVTFTAATGVLAGTPAVGTGGSYTLQFSATNAQGTTTQAFTLNVNEAPVITSANATTFTIGNAGSFTVTASGFPAPTFALVGALPSGVSFSSATGVLSGTPAVGTGGSYPVSITATNVAGTSPAQNFTLTVNAAPVITSAAATTFVVGTPGTFTVTTTGTPTVSTITRGGAPLPGSITFLDNGNGTATLSGTPAALSGGVYNLTFTASNGVVPNAVQNFTLTVQEAPQITSANSATFTLGNASSFTVTATGFPAPTFSAVGALPSGITFNPGTGTLSGTPLAGSGGSYPLTVTASNGVAPNATQNFTLTVQDGPIFTSANTTTFSVGVAGSFTVAATGSPTPTLSMTMGSLPAGVTFTAATGVLSGTPGPGTGGSYVLEFSATNAQGTATQSFTLNVNQSPTFTSVNNTAFAVGSAGSFTVTTAGFPTPALSLAACTPALPSSISFVPATGVLSGTPVNGDAGSYSCPFTATNGVAPDANQAFTLTINQAPVAQNDAGLAFTVDSGSTLALAAGTLFADNGSGADARGFPLANIASFGGGSAGGVVTDNAAGSADTTIPGFTNGSLTIGADGSLSFTPPTTVTRFCGLFTTDYRLTNTQGSDDATISITVRCASIAQNDLFNGGFGSTLTGVTRSGDLNDDNGSGADDLGSPAATLTSFGGGSLGGTVTTNAAGTSVAFASGTLTVNADGTFTLVDVDTSGTFTFDYRLTNTSGTDDGTVTFVIDAPPTVSSTVPLDNAISVPNTSDVVVNFSETVTITAGAISVDCGSGPVAGALSGTGTATGTFNPTANLPGNAVCVVTVLSANITDTDTNDAPNFLDGDVNGIEGGNFSFDFTVASTANDDAYTVTPHLTLSVTGAIQGGGVRGNDDPTSVTITGFGGTLATANGTVPDGINSVTASGAGGAVVMSADGTFTFFPDAGDSNTTALFFYTVTGGDTAQVTLTLQNQELIWFVDDNAVGTVCNLNNVGTQACPAATLAAGTAADTANDTLFVATGAYTCGITLTASERMLGDGSSGTLQALSGVTPIAGSGLPAFSTVAPTISGAADCITLATNNTLRGFTVGDSGAANSDIVGTAFGTLTVNEVLLNGTGCALNLSNGTAAATFTGVTSTASASTGVTIDQLAGSLTLGSTTIGGNTTQGILVGVTTATINFGNTSVTGGTDGISLQNNPSGTFNFGTLTRTGGSGTGFLHVLNGGSVSAGATTISGTGNFGIDINGHLTPRTISFGATSVVKSSAGNAIGLGGANPNSGSVTFAELSGSTTSGSFMSAINNTGTVTASAPSASAINAIGGAAFSISSLTTSPVALSLGSVSSTGGAEGIILVNVTGTFNASGGTLSNATSTDVQLSGGTTNFTYGGSISDDLGALVSISGQTAGTKSFTGAITDGNDGDGSGISLTSNAGATIRFSGGLQLSTGANPAFTATGGGTVEVCDENPCAPAATGALANTLTTTTATALDVASTNIGANDLEFRSINVDGNDAAPVNAIVLNATGTAGGLNVKGNGGAGSGGTIQDTSGDAILLMTTEKVGLARMSITSNLGTGISGTGVHGFVLTNSSITVNGDDAASDDSGIDLVGLTGTAAGGARPTSITNTTFTDNFEFELQITNTAGTLTNLQMSGNTLSSDGFQLSHGNLFNFLGLGNAAMTVNLTSGTFTGNTDTSGGKIITATGIQCDHSGTGGTMNCNVGGATFTNNNVGPQSSVSNGGNMLSDFNNVTATGGRAHGENHFVAANYTGSIGATVQNSTIGTLGVASSASSLGFGVRLQNESVAAGTSSRLRVVNSTVQETASFNLINVNQGIFGQTSSGPSFVTVTNNTLRNSGARAVLVSQNNTTDADSAGASCANISGNSTANIFGQVGDGTVIRLRRLDANSGAGDQFRVTQTDANNLAAVNSLALVQLSLSGTLTFNGGACALP